MKLGLAVTAVSHKKQKFRNNMTFLDSITIKLVPLKHIEKKIIGHVFDVSLQFKDQNLANLVLIYKA